MRRGKFVLQAYVDADVLALAEAARISWSDWIARAVREQAQRERAERGPIGAES